MNQKEIVRLENELERQRQELETPSAMLREISTLRIMADKLYHGTFTNFDIVIQGAGFEDRFHRSPPGTGRHWSRPDFNKILAMQFVQYADALQRELDQLPSLCPPIDAKP